MSNQSLKWTFLLAYVVLAIWFGVSYSCPEDTARPMILSISLAYIVNLNINFFLKLPMNVLHFPEARNVTNFSARRRLVLITWAMFLAAVIWGIADDFSCNV